MTNSEFSNEFDVLYNSITSNQAPGLNEYEKSVFLTKAQDDVLKSYLDPRSNKVQEGFDDSSRRQIDFSKSIITTSYQEDTLYASNLDTRSNSRSCTIGDLDILILLNERLRVSKKGSNDLNDLVVLPLKYNEYDRLLSKPYKRPIKGQAWRIISGADGLVDLIPGPSDSIEEYTIRYVKRPLPIILDKLEGETIGGFVGSDINGVPTKNPEEAVSGIECELDPNLHLELLQRGVELAKAVYIGDLQSQLALGQVSQTDIGIIQTRQ